MRVERDTKDSNPVNNNINNNNNNEEYEDILNDVRNLFIEEPESEEDATETGPRVIFEKTVEDEKKAEIKGKESKVENIKTSQPTENNIQNKVIFDGKGTTDSKDSKGKESKDNKADTKNNNKDTKKDKTTAAEVIKPGVCKSSSDCGSGLFCHQKSGTCKQQFLLNTPGCTSNEQCAADTADGLVVCYKKKCSKACKIGSNSWCSEGVERCTEVKDSKVFQGLTFNGICTKGTAVSSKSSSDGMGTSSIVLLSAASILLFIATIIGYIYIRGYMRRRYRNNNPDMFLFNKLQQSTSQSLQNIGKGSVGSASEHLNSRLSNIAGARFTRWAVLSDQ